MGRAPEIAGKKAIKRGAGKEGEKSDKRMKKISSPAKEKSKQKHKVKNNKLKKYTYIYIYRKKSMRSEIGSKIICYVVCEKSGLFRFGLIVVKIKKRKNTRKRLARPRLWRAWMRWTSGTRLCQCWTGRFRSGEEGGR